MTGSTPAPWGPPVQHRTEESAHLGDVGSGRILKPELQVGWPLPHPRREPVHSQLLEASVELHVHGIERVQAAPVLYVSAGREERQGSGQRRDHRKDAGFSARDLGLNPGAATRELGSPPSPQRSLSLLYSLSAWATHTTWMMGLLGDPKF